MTGDFKLNDEIEYNQIVKSWSEYMLIEFTPFGYQFLDACIEKLEPNN